MLYIAFSTQCLKYKRPNCSTTESHHGVLIQSQYHVLDPSNRAYYMYVSKSCVKQYLKAIVYMLVTRLAFMYVCEQVQEQLHFSHALASKLCRITRKELISFLQKLV